MFPTTHVRVRGALAAALLATTGCGGGGPGGAAGPLVVRFSEMPAGLDPLREASVAWGDIDGDGDLDLATAGIGFLGNQDRIYRNDAGVFTDVGAGLLPVGPAALAWGDMDQDGDLDLALAAHAFSRLYRNDGGGVFTVLNPGLVGVDDGGLAWGDMDQDGDLDLALAGETASGRVTRVYRNDGGGTFTDAVPGLLGVSRCSLAWGDMDQDGDLDLAITGLSIFGASGRLYRNDGGGTLTDSGAGFFAAIGSLAWGDMDGDGDLDLAVAGTQPFGGGGSNVFRNDGGGTFTDVGAGLAAVEEGRLAWGDADGDGDLDLALSGGATFVYRNDGGGVFTDVAAGLADLFRGGLAWGDADGDGDLDLAVVGAEVGGVGSFAARVYENLGGAVIAPPTAPTGVQVVAGGTRVEWVASSDSATPADGLSYNLKVGTTAGGDDVHPGQSSPSGRRLLPERGVVQPSGAGGFALIDLPPGAYFVSVQAVDAGFEASPWSAPVGFVVP